MFLTIGLFGLTALYVGMVIAIHYLSPIDCLVITLDDNNYGDVNNNDIGNTTTTVDESQSQQLEMEQTLLCQSEGVDNTILNWSSDFFIAIWMFLFAFQLSICPRTTTTTTTTTSGKGKGERSTSTNDEVLDSGILAQVFMGGAFVLSGIGSLLFPNSGTDDNHGMLGYWITYIMYAVFFTASGLCMAHFALETTKNTNPVQLQLVVGICELLLVLSLSGFLAGSIWCSTDLTLQVNEVTDEWMRIDNTDDTTTEVDLHVCFTISYYSEMGMNMAYTLLWLPIGFLLHAASQQKPKVVLGLPTPVAAVLATILQWTVGSMLLVVLFLVNLIRNDDDEPFMIWNTMYGTVLYHWGILITFYCLHNISCGLTVRCESDVYEVDDIHSDNDNDDDNNDDNNDNDNDNNNDNDEVHSSSSSWWSLFFKNHNKNELDKMMTKKQQKQHKKEKQRREAVAHTDDVMLIDLTSSVDAPTQNLKSVSFQDDGDDHDHKDVNMIVDMNGAVVGRSFYRP